VSPPPGGEAREGALSATAVAGSWVGDELQRALARADALGREVEQLHAVLRAQQEAIAALHEAVGTVQGRTLRHEAGQELAREARQEVAALQEELRAEAASRRELAARLERAGAHERKQQEQLLHAIASLQRRLDRSEGRQAAGDERQRHIAIDLAERDQEEQSLEGRLGALERRAAADQEHDRHVGDELARATGVLPRLSAELDELQGRVQTLLMEQRRLDDDVAALRAIRDREGDLLDVLEQQRATRARTEERINAVEEQLEQARRALAESAEERALLARAQSGLEERLRALGEELEAQRLLFIAHLRRQLQVGEQAGRRRADEIEREARLARDLLVRLSEESAELRGGRPL